MSLEERVEGLIRDFPAWGPMQGDFSSAGMQTAYRDKLPALALGFRLGLDPRVTDLVRQLTAIPAVNQVARAREMACWLPRGAGRRVVTELLLRAAEGGRIRFAGAAAMAWSPDAPAGPTDVRKRPKGTVDATGQHDAFRSCARMADIAVRLLLGDASGLEPPSGKRADAHQQQFRSFLHEAAAQILRRGEHDGDGERPVPVSRMQLRRAA